MHRGQGIENLGDMKETMHPGTCEDSPMAQLQGMVGDEPGHGSRDQILKNLLGNSN